MLNVTVPSSPVSFLSATEIVAPLNLIVPVVASYDWSIAKTSPPLLAKLTKHIILLNVHHPMLFTRFHIFVGLINK